MANDRLSRCASELHDLLEALDFADWEIRAFHAPSECFGLAANGIASEAHEVLERYGYENMDAFERELEERTCAKFVWEMGFAALE